MKAHRKFLTAHQKSTCRLPRSIVTLRPDFAATPPEKVFNIWADQPFAKPTPDLITPKSTIGSFFWQRRYQELRGLFRLDSRGVGRRLTLSSDDESHGVAAATAKAFHECWMNHLAQPEVRKEWDEDQCRPAHEGKSF